MDNSYVFSPALDPVIYLVAAVLAFAGASPVLFLAIRDFVTGKRHGNDGGEW